MTLINRSAIVTAIEKALTKGGYTDIPVVWKAEGVPFYTTKDYPALVTLNVSSLTTYGLDQTIREFNHDTNLIDITIRGMRDFTLAVRIEADDSLLAQEMAHAVGLHMKSDAVYLILREECLRFIRILASTSLGETIWDNREVSSVNCDLLCRVDFSYLETEPESGGQWIEKVSGEAFGEPYLIDGTILP